MLEKILSDGFAQMGLSVDETALERFRIYYDLLDQRSKVMNLTAINGEEDTARLHFLDCVSPLLCEDLSDKKVIDIGTGAGFPGLPLKIISPSIKLTLLDSLDKRVRFLSEVCSATNLSDVECIHARAEEPGDRRDSYDFALSRAVARLNVLCELCLPYVRVGGAFLALKGPALREELAQSEKAISQLGGKLECVFEYSVPGVELEHNIAVIRKIRSTPGKYPRRFATIKKSPL